MSTVESEPGLLDPIDDPIELKPGKLRELTPRALVIRFTAGAVTSIAAGAVTLAFGARVGGVLLAFPAILAASLTLIEDQENSHEAREDARGAVAGGAALAVFALISTLALGQVAGALALALAAGAWLIVAIALYLVVWRR